MAELRALDRPVLARAAICLVFGLVTVFWQQPTLAVAQYGTGLYLVALGLVLLWTQRTLNTVVFRDYGAKERSSIQSFAVLYGLGGILVVLFVRQTVHLVLTLGLVLVIAGITELLLGLRGAASAMSKDWRIAGMVSALAGTALFVFGELGPHSVFGITGASALIIGVFHAIAALTFRHDAAHLTRRAEQETGPARS